MKFGAKKNLALILCLTIPLIFGGIAYYLFGKILYLFGAAILTIPIIFLLANSMVRHPIIDALMGNGTLAFAILENGLWLPFTVKAKGGFIDGVVRGLKIEGIMDRSLLQYLGRPAKGYSTTDTQNNKMILELDLAEYTRSKHYTDQIGFFLYSMKLKQFITKEMVAGLENQTFSKHMITYTAYKVRELTSILRDFSRTYVDLYKENKPFWEQGWFKWVVIGALVLIVGYFMWPSISKALAGNLGGLGNAAGALTAPATTLKVPS